MREKACRRCVLFIVLGVLGVGNRNFGSLSVDKIVELVYLYVDKSCRLCVNLRSISRITKIFLLLKNLRYRCNSVVDMFITAVCVTGTGPPVAEVLVVGAS